MSRLYPPPLPANLRRFRSVLSAVLGAAFLALAFSGHHPTASIVKANPDPSNTPPDCYFHNDLGGSSTPDHLWRDPSDKVSKLDTQAQANAYCWSMYEPYVEVEPRHDDPDDVSLTAEGDEAKWEGEATMEVGRRVYVGGAMTWERKGPITQFPRIVVHRVRGKDRWKGAAGGFVAGAGLGAAIGGAGGGIKGAGIGAVIGGIGGGIAGAIIGVPGDLENKIKDDMTEVARLTHDSSWEGGILGIGKRRKEIWNSYADGRGHFSEDTFWVWHFSHKHALSLHY